MSDNPAAGRRLSRAMKTVPPCDKVPAMRRSFVVTPLGLCLLAAPPALANDSTAEMAAGGITLLKSDGIAMKSEDLAISIDEVRVRYIFPRAEDFEPCLPVKDDTCR